MNERARHISPRTPHPTGVCAARTTSHMSAHMLWGLLFFLIMSAMPFASASGNETLLGGRAFSPPDQIIPMGEDWERQGITHKTPEPVDLAVALDQQLYPALGPMIETFAKERGVRIAVQNGTCGISAGLLSEKAVEMGGFCCPPGVTDRLPGLKFHTIGIGALALIVHPDNPISDIPLDKARALFGPDVRDWSELPMSGYRSSLYAPVKAIARLHCKARPGHWRLILDKEQDFGWEITEVSAIRDMIQQVSSQPGAIGYETLWHIHRIKRDEGNTVKTVKVDGTAPENDEAVIRGQYPLYRVFNITTWGEGPAHKALADELADYLIAQADQIERKYAILPVSKLRKNGWRFDGNELISEPN